MVTHTYLLLQEASELEEIMVTAVCSLWARGNPWWGVLELAFWPLESESVHWTSPPYASTLLYATANHLRLWLPKDLGIERRIK